MYSYAKKISLAQVQGSQWDEVEFRRAPDCPGISFCEETIQWPSIYEMKPLNPCLLTSVPPNPGIIKDKGLFLLAIK